MSVAPTIFIDGQGATVSVGGTNIGGISGVSGIGSGQAGERDRTLLSSVGFKEFGIGLQDPGTAQIDFFADTTDNGQCKLWDSYKNRSKLAYVVTLVNGTVFSFSAYVRKCAITPGTDADVKGQAELRITGALAGGYPAPT